jgi:hypothetical protein
MPVPGGASECYLFGDKCGCDATFTCWRNLGDPEYDGSGNKMWAEPCKFSVSNQGSILYTGGQGVSTLEISPANAMYDNSEATKQSLQAPIEIYLGYHLQRDRRIVGAIVKGSDASPAVTRAFDVGVIRERTASPSVNVLDQSTYRINPFEPSPTATRASRDFSNPVGLGYSDKIAVIHTDFNGSYAYLHKSFNDWVVISEFRVYEAAPMSRCASTLLLNETKPASRTSYKCFRVSIPNQPLIDGRCGRCFYFNRRCGCDATFTCGASGNELCAMPTVKGKLTDDLALVDDNESTFYDATYDSSLVSGGFTDYSAALSVDLERARAIVSIMVKGFDQNGEWAQHNMKPSNNSDPFSTDTFLRANTNIYYTNQNKLFNYAISKRVRYVHLYQIITVDLPFKVSEFRVFEEADKSFCSYLDPPPVSVGCSSLALLDHQTSAASNTVPLQAIAGNSTGNGTCLLQKFTSSDRLLFYKLNVEAQDPAAINLANYVRVTAQALGVSEDKIKIVVNSPTPAAGRRLLAASNLVLIVTIITDNPTQATALANEVYTSGFQNRLQESAVQSSVPIPIVQNTPLVIYDSTAGLLSTLNLTMNRPVGLIVVIQTVQPPLPAPNSFSRAPPAHGAGSIPLTTVICLVLVLQVLLWVQGPSLFALE